MVMYIFLNGVNVTHEPHFCEKTAEKALKGLKYTDKEGKEHTEPKWTEKMIEEATKGLKFPEGTTTWDKYVAYNSFYADTCSVLSDGDILEAAYEFYFNDEDYRLEGSKIWHYMRAMTEGK